MTVLTKPQLRQQLLEQRKNLSIIEREQRSREICTQIRELPEWQQASAILFYYPLDQEVNILPLAAESLMQGKTAVFPKVDPAAKKLNLFSITDLNQDFQKGYAGIQEPTENNPKITVPCIDLAFIPGVGFDLQGNRLGWGKGYYDKLLHQTKALRVGIGYEFQIKEAVPREEQDVPLHYIITEKRCIRIIKHGYHP